jgi:hypothetical protein
MRGVNGLFRSEDHDPCFKAQDASMPSNTEQISEPKA